MTGRRIDPAFQEVLCSALLVWMPAHRDHALSDRAARRRLAKAIDLPRGQMEAWPSECVDLVIRAQMTLDGQGREVAGGIDKASIQAATDAKWERPRYAWQDRVDVGDGAEMAA